MSDIIGLLFAMSDVIPMSDIVKAINKRVLRMQDSYFLEERDITPHTVGS